MQKINVNNELFDLLLKHATKKAFETEDEDISQHEYIDRKYEPSAALDKRISKIINSHSQGEKLKSWKMTALKAAAVFGVVFAVSSTVLLSVEASRNIIFNAVLQWNEEYLSVQYSEAPEKELIIYRPSYLPEGFKEESFITVGNVNIITYVNEIGVKISLQQSKAKTSSIDTDIEGKNASELLINKNNAYLIEGRDLNDDNVLFWEQSGFIFYITSLIEGNELILIAESLIK